jgi:glutaredoxin 3
MQQAKIVMYATAWCGYCARARRLFERKGLRFEEIDVDALPGARVEMVRRSGRGSVPQVFIGATYVGGAHELQALEASGELDSLLAREAM